jgi:hypothetical protein
MLIPAWVINVSDAKNPKPGNPIFVPKKRTQNMSERGKKAQSQDLSRLLPQIDRRW